MHAKSLNRFAPIVTFQEPPPTLLPLHSAIAQNRSNGQRQALHHAQADKDNRQEVSLCHLRRRCPRIHHPPTQASMFEPYMKRMKEVED
jgi:hypothetical protein